MLKFLDNQSNKILSIFHSFSFTDARYLNGEFKGKRVEAAVRNINRIGLNLNVSKFSATFQANFTEDSFGDASNIKSSADPVAGYIPAYTVLDCSMQYKVKNQAFKAGMNNIANQNYFTRRTDEYPGPGIIPAVGKSFTLV